YIMAKKQDTRTRNWKLFVYPESVPSFWREFLDSYAAPLIASSLIVQDVTSVGAIHTAFWYVLLM
ncbi:Rep family protein, partial [Staphylococcus aureus]